MLHANASECKRAQATVHGNVKCDKQVYASASKGSRVRCFVFILRTDNPSFHLNGERYQLKSIKDGVLARPT